MLVRSINSSTRKCVLKSSFSVELIGNKSVSDPKLSFNPPFLIRSLLNLFVISFNKNISL
ncbi:hypothetical protein NUSPORA_02023 [Nucleospora cyclopteri]